MSNMLKPELLMPAGSVRKMKYAFAHGADAVYAGVPIFSLRARENEVSFEELGHALNYSRQMGKKLYLTANVFARNLKIKSFIRQLDEWVSLKPDAMIMSDPGLMRIVREKYPQIPIHLSVQANCMNYESVKFWRDMGVSRIILSRELRLEEIKEIKQQVPDIELEAFVHGAICIAYSGRCLLSYYMSHRDANQGVCDNSCRYGFNIHKADAQAYQGDYFLEDLREKGEFYRIDEDENGTYIMNAKDLCLLDHLQELCEAGVCSLKVEGRTKSLYYVSMVTRIYRQAIDDMIAGKPFNPQLLAEIEKVPNRGYHSGFMLGSMGANAQNYQFSTQRNFTQQFAGLVLEDPAESGRVKVEVRNRLSKGQKLEVIEPGASSSQTTIRRIWSPKGNEVETVHGGTGVFDFEFDFTPQPFTILSLIQ